MAGKKGRSGGARPGAGRPRKPIALRSYPITNDSVQFLLMVMNDQTNEMRLRLEAAQALMPYFHKKKSFHYF